jgi:hypothetical protein
VEPNQPLCGVHHISVSFWHTSTASRSRNLFTFNLYAEAVVHDQVQNGKDCFAEPGHSGHGTAVQVAETYPPVPTPPSLPPRCTRRGRGAAGAHMRCGTRVCDPVRVSVHVRRAGKTDTCAGGELRDLGVVRQRRQQRGGGGSTVGTAGLRAVAVGVTLFNVLLHIFVRAVLLVARVLVVPFASAEAALDAQLVLAGRAGGGAQGSVTGRGEKRAAVGVALGLLNLVHMRSFCCMSNNTKSAYSLRGSTQSMAIGASLLSRLLTAYAQVVWAVPPPGLALTSMICSGRSLTTRAMASSTRDMTAGSVSSRRLTIENRLLYVLKRMPGTCWICTALILAHILVGLLWC